jgi:glycosyltransferase involved in cell wall biosynthesis
MESAAGNGIEFSVVIPVYNEEDVLPKLFPALTAAFDSWVNGHWEVIFVDDGGGDQTAFLIAGRNATDPRFKSVRLSRNFGHQAAVSTGLAFAAGRFIGVIDADLQDPIDILRTMYEACRAGACDVAYGVRKKREVPVLLDLSYKTFYRFMNRFSDHPWPVDAGDFCVLDRKALHLLLQLPETTRILRGLRSWIGLHQMPFSYDRPKRVAGSSKYNLIRLSRLAVDSVIGFSTAPLQFAVIGGLCTSFLCAVITGLFFLNRLVPSFTLFGYSVGASPGVATIVILVSLVSAINFFCLAIIGQYLALVLREVKRRPQAIVREVIGEARRQEVAFPLHENE